jgi:imidazolonepropionase-like amidohydrolase
MDLSAPSQSIAIGHCALIDPSGFVPSDTAGIMIEDGKIKGYMDSKDLEDVTGSQVQVIDASGLSLLPGFIDCHLHLSGLRKGFPPGSWPLSNREERMVRSVRQAWDLLMAGFTTVVDNSPHGPFLRNMIERGEILGPRIIPCGKGLAATGGAGHIPFFSEATIRKSHPWAITCDGVDNLRLEVRRLRQEGADWIKFWASGARMWERDKGTDVQYSQEEMKAIVDEAHRYGLKVQAHSTCNQAAKLAIKAGTDCLLHGEGLMDDCKGLLLDHKAAWLPTLHILQLRRNPQRIPIHEHPGLSQHYENVFDYYQKGVHVAFGSDTFSDERTPYGEHGFREIKEFTKAGLSPMETLKIATVEGAKLLGKEHHWGSLKVGATADLILMKGRPDQDISAFDDVENIVLVMRDGVVFKDSLGLSNDSTKCLGPFCSVKDGKSEKTKR